MSGNAASGARIASGRLAAALLGFVRRAARAGLPILLSLALIGSGFGGGMAFEQPAPPAPWQSSQHQHGCDSTASQQQHDPPCKHLGFACMSDAGCLLVIGLPAAVTHASEVLPWAKVAYWSQPQMHQGIEAAPGLGPPIAI